jgi:hypothetical protein
MERFIQLFGSWLQFSYSCFDRIVVNAYLLALIKPAWVACFFRRVCGIDTITKEVLQSRSLQYQKWVEGYARNHRIPTQWAESGVRKEDFVKPYLEKFLRQKKYGVYFILKSMEQSNSYRISKSSADKPHPHLVAERMRFTHYYFYLVDEVLGPMSLRIASFLPFAATAYINGHNYIERQLLKQKIAFRKADNAFLSVKDTKALQRIADTLSGDLIGGRLDYWIFMLGPKFSQKERRLNPGLRRRYSVNQIEYCRNFIFKQSFPLRSLFQRCSELGLHSLSGARLVNLWGYRIHRRFSGKLQNVFEGVNRGTTIFRTFLKGSFLKLYQKFQTFLRIEIVINNLHQFRLGKSLKNLSLIQTKCQEITDRFAGFKADALNLHPEFDLFSTMAKPVLLCKTKISGIKLEQERILRLFEVLLSSGTVEKLTGKEILNALQLRFELTPEQYSLNQLRYDLRKLRAHQLIQRVPGRYGYQFTEKGKKVALMFLLVAKRIYSPISGSLFVFKPLDNQNSSSKFERAFYQVDHSIDRLLELLPAS